MKKISLFKAIAAGSSLLLLTSCGNSSLGGGADEFKTVWVSAEVESGPDFEVLSGNTCSATGSTGGTFTTDSVNVTVSSARLFPTGTALNVAVDRVTISYTPANTSAPVIPDEYNALGNIIPPDGSAVISVPVAKSSVKKSLVDNGKIQLCSGTSFPYHVTIAFDIVEMGTGERKSITKTTTMVLKASNNS